MLGEDLVLVLGQQERLQAGGDTWANPVSYDKLAVRYRRWRNTVASQPGSLMQPGARSAVTMSAGELFTVDDEGEGFVDEEQVKVDASKERAAAVVAANAAQQ